MFLSSSSVNLSLKLLLNTHNSVESCLVLRESSEAVDIISCSLFSYFISPSYSINVT